MKSLDEILDTLQGDENDITPNEHINLLCAAVDDLKKLCRSQGCRIARLQQTELDLLQKLADGDCSGHRRE